VAVDVVRDQIVAADGVESDHERSEHESNAHREECTDCRERGRKVAVCGAHGER
jgi:hypothetical protein